MWAHGRFSMIFKVLDLIRREDAPAAGASALFIRFKFGGIIGSVEVGIAELIIFFLGLPFNIRRVTLGDEAVSTERVFITPIEESRRFRVAVHFNGRGNHVGVVLIVEADDAPWPKRSTRLKK